MAIDDPRALRSAGSCWSLAALIVEPSLDLVSDRALAPDARGAGGSFHPTKSSLLSCLFSAKPGARGNGDVVAGGAGCGCDHRQHSVAIARLFSLEQEDSGGGRQWRLKAVASYSSPTTECLTRSARARCIPYLRELAKRGVQFTLLSFERAKAFTPEGIAAMRTATRETAKRRESNGTGCVIINGHRYRQRSTTCWPVIAKPARSFRRNRIEMVHARGHIPATIALGLKSVSARR